MTKHGQTMSEAYKKVLLGEDNMALMKKAAGGAMQKLKMKDGKLQMDSFTASAIMQIYKAVNDKNKKTMENLINSGNKAAIMKLQKFAMSKINSSYGEELDDEDKPVVSFKKEEVELDEGKMKELHGYISQGKSAKEIAKIMKLDVKTIKALMAGYMMSGYNEEKNCGCGQDPCVTYGESVKEGARADARRAMRNDPVLGKRKDKDDDDDEASAADKKAASKNILMQLQKVVSLKGGELKLTPSKKKATAKGNYGKTKGDNFIEFSNGKKEKVDPKVAQAVFKKYMSMQRPIDKQKFTIKISKSYKDMLAALKESLGEAKSPLQRLKDFDKVRVGVGKKPIFKDNEKKDIKEEDEDVADARKEAQAAVAAAKDRLADTNAEQPRDAEKVEAAKENLRKKQKALKDVDDPKKTKARADAKKKKAENDKFKDAKLKSRIKIAQERVRAAKSGTEEHSNALDALQNAKDAYKKYKEKTKFGKVKSFMKKTAKGAALGVAATAKLGDSFDPTIKREAILDRIDKKLQEKKDG